MKNQFKILIAEVLLLLCAVPVKAAPPLITTINQIAPRVRTQIVSSAPVFGVIQSSMNAIYTQMGILTNQVVHLSSTAAVLTGTQTFTGTNTFQKVVDAPAYTLSGRGGLRQYNDNLALGDTTGDVNLGGSNIYIGYLAGAGNTLNANTYIGFRCGVGVSGSNNSCIGADSCYGTHGLNGVTSVGTLSGYANYNATNTTYLGYNAGVGSGGGTSNDLFLGANSGASVDGTSNSIALGAGVLVSTSNQLNIGNLLTGNLTIGSASATIKGILGVQKTFPDQFTIDDVDSGAPGGVLNMGGITGIASLIDANVYYAPGIVTHRSKAGGGGELFFDTSNGPSGGDFMISRSTAGPANGILTGSSLLNWLTYRAATNRLGIGQQNPTALLDVGGDATVEGTLSVGYEWLTHSCTGTNCSVACTAGKHLLGGGCSASPQVSPLDTVFGTSSIACNAGSSANITVSAACARIN